MATSSIEIKKRQQFIYLFYSKSSYSIRVSFLNINKTSFNEQYYNTCCNLNDFLTSFELNTDPDNNTWIFILKDYQKKKHDVVIPPTLYEAIFNDVAHFNMCIKRLKQCYKKQVVCDGAILGQEKKLMRIERMNEEKCKRDSRYVCGSLRSTSKTHRQRLKNLLAKRNRITYKAESIFDIWITLECIIASSSKEYSSLTPSLASQQEEPSVDILNVAWQLTVQAYQELL